MGIPSVNTTSCCLANLAVMDSSPLAPHMKRQIKYKYKCRTTFQWELSPLQRWRDKSVVGGSWRHMACRYFFLKAEVLTATLRLFMVGTGLWLPKSGLRNFSELELKTPSSLSTWPIAEQACCSGLSLEQIRCEKLEPWSWAHCKRPDERERWGMWKLTSQENWKQQTS